MRSAIKYLGEEKQKIEKRLQEAIHACNIAQGAYEGRQNQVKSLESELIGISNAVALLEQYDQTNPSTRNP